MALTLYNIKKWILMLSGKSIMHVNQGVGRCYSVGDIFGYYNDLTEKVTKDPLTLCSDHPPMVKIESGETIYFSIAVFQYGLGAYDLYLQRNDIVYLEKFWQCVQWAIQTQGKMGESKTFSHVYPNAPYSAMAQGELCSLLLRAYRETKDLEYLARAEKAIDFMLTPVELGGTAKYENDQIIFLEYTELAPVLNGWIFALFGLYDLTLVCDDKKYNHILQKAVISLKNNLCKFDNGYWSLYDLDNKITSPFYHRLHIAQLEALYTLFRMEEFKWYMDKWNDYQRNRFNVWKAFIVKSIQKIREQ